MEFIETSIFTRLVYAYLSDDEFVGLQFFLLKYPEAGNVIPGSGGVRKLRWAMTGTGKSGGVRIIYYFKKRDEEIWLLTIYNEYATPVRFRFKAPRSNADEQAGSNAAALKSSAGTAMGHAGAGLASLNGSGLAQ